MYLQIGKILIRKKHVRTAMLITVYSSTFTCQLEHVSKMYLLYPQVIKACSKQEQQYENPLILRGD